MPLSVAYINPFVASVRTLFTTMGLGDAVLCTPRVRRPGEDLARAFEVAVVVELSGPTSGVVAVMLSRRVACALGSSLAGVGFSSVDADCRDALGELGNMLVGQAKAGLPGGSSRMTVPQVAETASVRWPARTPVLVVPFDTPHGRLAIGVACRTDPAAALAAQAETQAALAGESGMDAWPSPAGATA
jgi:chemotaxis protein CheX